MQLPLEQARVLAVEMRGLGTDHCAHHHLAVIVAEALGGKVSHIILNVLDNAGDVTCMVRKKPGSAPGFGSSGYKKPMNKGIFI